MQVGCRGWALKRRCRREARERGSWQGDADQRPVTNCASADDVVDPPLPQWTPTEPWNSAVSTLSLYTHKHTSCTLAAMSSYHRRAVAQPCVNGDRLSQGRMAKFDPAQIRNPSTDRHKIWNRWWRPRDDPLCKISCKSVHWGLLGKWMKYNENFSSIHNFLLTDLQVRPPGGFSRATAQTTRPHARVKPCFNVSLNLAIVFGFVLS